MITESLATGGLWALAVATLLGCLVAAATSRWAVALGLLFAVSTLSRLVIPIGTANLRLEQPTIAALFLFVLVRHPGELFATVRRAWVPALGAALYLAASAASSVVYSPDVGKSLRIVLWLALSMAAGAVAAVGVRHVRLRDVSRWIIGIALIQVGVALAAVTSQVLYGTDWGVQYQDVLIGKSYGLAREANLLGIMLAACVPFALTAGFDRGRRLGMWRLAAIVALGLGIGLAYSRGGMLALIVAGLVMLVAAVAAAGRAWVRPVAFLSGQIILVLLVSFAAIQVQDAFARSGVRNPTGIVVLGAIAAPEQSQGALPAPPAGAPSPSRLATGTPAPDPRYVGAGDTIAVRMRNLIIALQEVRQSPAIGLGTDTFGMRHIEPSCRCPAHISNLTVAALYESGIVGATGLVVLLLAVLSAAWRSRAWQLLGALAALVVGYQFTDAFRFADNWILIGLAVGFWIQHKTNADADGDTAPNTADARSRP